MDQAKQKFRFKCPQHPDFKFEFLQINNISANKKYQKLLYCSDCAFQDSNFKLSNFTLIKHIIKAGDNQIIQNWPPVNYNQLIKQLIQISTGDVEIESIEDQIHQYFTDLKAEILKQIDISQKKMIKQAQELPQFKRDILNKYQELSKANELKSILTDEDTDMNAKEQKCRELVENMLAQKKTITEQLESLLDQNSELYTVFNPETAIEIKESILKSLSSINMFEQANIESGNGQKNPKQLDVSLFTTDYYNGEDNSKISMNENNQYQILIKEECDDWLNTVSNLILEKEKKYVFRIEIEMKNEEDQCGVGLIQSSSINSRGGYNDFLSCGLQQKNQCIRQYTNSQIGITKLVKGNGFKLSKENVIEMRVCIEDQVLEVFDFPNYSSKLELLDLYKSNLTDYKDLRLYLGMFNLNNRAILKEAFTVSKFE